MSETSSLNMDPPAYDETIKPGALEDMKEEVDEIKPEKMEVAKDDGPFFHCNLSDAQMVSKVAEEFLPGLASACIDNTTGGLLSSPASVAVDIRREMVDYLVQRSETFVAESVVLEADSVIEMSDNPHDIISDFIDDFALSKRNFFSKVSAWALSERREERIDDFIQEMEINGFWLMARRVTVAQTLIRNIDFKNSYHCNMKFKSEEELSEHISSCSFRELNCENEGCNARFSAAQLELHDSICPFKILQCEQKCPETLMRREMDRHCITVCPMKLVNCPFYPVGCVSTIPHCTMDQHRLDNLQSHLICILKLIHKEASLEALKKRAEKVLEASSPGRLATARDARSLTVAIKSIDAKLGPIEVEENTEVNADGVELKDEKEDSTDVSTKKDCSIDLPHKDDQSPDLPKSHDNSTALQHSTGPSEKTENILEPTVKTDSSTNEHHEKADGVELKDEKEDSTDVSTKKDCSIDLPHKDEPSPDSPKSHHNSTALQHNTEPSEKPENIQEPTLKTDSSINEHYEKADSRDPHLTKNSSPEPLVEKEGSKSPDKTEESLSTSSNHQDLTTSAHRLESSKSEESPKKHHYTTASPHEAKSP